MRSTTSGTKLDFRKKVKKATRNKAHMAACKGPGGGGELGYFLGGYVPPGTPNWHPVLKYIPPKIDTPF